MPQLTPRDDVRKAASEILKRVDHLIRAGEIENSMREIIRAKEIDPSNVYVHAYEERLAFLKEQHEKNAEQERTRREAERAARERDELRRREQEEEARREAERIRQAEEARRAEEAKLAEARKRLELERQRKLEQERAQQSTARVAEPPPPLHHPVSSDHNEGLYIKAFQNAWSAGHVTPQRTTTLEQLGKDLGISPDRQRQLEGQVRAATREMRTPDSVLVIDDDESMLTVIAQMLSVNGFQVTALPTSDEAYTLLRKWKPGLILCDVNLETSTMGGFSFYEKVREMDHLRDVPFLFLTGLTDDVIVRTGKELGADDYLTKPISEENLVAIVKGKIKRFKKLRAGNSPAA